MESTSIPRANPSTEQLLQAYWSNDFQPLSDVGQRINAALRADEESADVYRKIASHPTASHLYFSNDDLPPPEQSLQHVQSIPLPTLLSQQLTMVRMYSGMGLLAEANLAWLSVDDKLYLWSYQSDSFFSPPPGATAAPSSVVCSMNMSSGQCVVAVGLVRPKKGRLEFSVVC
jgi:Nup133 N terminal like